ncbi:MAG: PQQ-binding-like beta-propeller repeat protein [Candidatus Sericytochromatia bacterium]|nr:PQQ-binding-like beta-propeller repeat protein [Candidatus Sericytochromatia bacterium]
MAMLQTDTETPDALLLPTLLQLAGVTPEALDALQAEQTATFEAARQAFAGTVWLVHVPSQTLLVQDFLSGELLAEIPLGRTGAGLFAADEDVLLDPGRYTPWGSALCGVQALNGQIADFIPVQNTALYGLVLTADQSLVYLPDMLQAPMLARSRQLHAPFAPGANAPEQTAYDLYVSEDLAYLCVSDRRAGALLWIDTASRSSLGWVQIREPGSDKALNLAFDYYEPRVFITDNVSQQLFLLSLPDLQLETRAIGPPGQVFGNLVRAPDIRYVYVLGVWPIEALFMLNLEEDEIEEQLQLKGSPYSKQALDPCDLMVLTPDQNHLLVLTQHHDPTPGTPGLSVIDPHQFQPLRFQPIVDALKNQTKPVGLVFLRANPLPELQKSPLELLLARGLISEAQLHEAQQLLQAQTDATPAEPLAAIDHELPVLARPAAEKIALPAERSVAAIVFILGQKLHQQHDLDLQEHAELKARFEALAEGYRQQLEQAEALEVLIPDIGEQLTLQTELTRQEVLSLLARGLGREQPVVKAPRYCPACREPLRGRWDCPACFLELESPPRQQRKENSSLRPPGALPPYQVLLADPLGRRLLVLDDKKTIDWELSGEDLPCDTPWSALWLPNKNILVVDREASRVLECSPGGKLTWELKQSLDPLLQLQQPQMAGYFSAGCDDRFLIADTGHHRVLVVDRRQKLIWHYGQQGQAGSEPGLLCAPTDLQLTFEGTWLIADAGNDRVLEVDAEGQIIRCFGPELGLQNPVFAQRLHDYDTLVVDSGNYRILEIDSEGQVVAECFYLMPDMDAEIHISTPVQMIRREKKSVLLVDTERAVEVLPPRQRLVWSALLEHLVQRLALQRDAFDKSDSYLQSFNQYRLPTMEELLARLREENRLGSSEGIAQRLLENLEYLIQARREREQEQVSDLQVKHLHNAPLSETPIFVLDRFHQQVSEIERSGAVLWQVGVSPETRLLNPTHISWTLESLLVADTHHNRILELCRQTHHLQQVWGVDDQLSQPRSAWRTLQGNLLIADQGHKRLVELNAAGEEVWEFKSPREIAYPYFARELGQGTILYVDWALHVVKEITREGELIWSYGQSSRMGHEDNRLCGPEYATRLHSGAILIADTGNHRLLEVSPQRRVLWEFTGNKKYTLYKPNACWRFPDGHTLIAYNGYRQLLEIDREGEACWALELGRMALA